MIKKTEKNEDIYAYTFVKKNNPMHAASLSLSINPLELYSYPFL